MCNGNAEIPDTGKSSGDISFLPPPPSDRTGWPWTEGSSSIPVVMPDGTPWPIISIVTPSYNQSEFLEATIRSVLLQNYPNLEYIVIDGGSTDNSAEIIEKYADFLSFRVSEKDRGHGHALNKGFSRSTGEIMAWINSDDMYARDALGTVAEIFNQHPDVNWITGTNSWWDRFGNRLRHKKVFKNKFDFLLGDYKWIQQESVFWRRALWDKAGTRINEDYELMVDGELWCRFFLHDQLWHVDKILSGYRKHNNNRAKKHMNKVKEELKKATHWLHEQSDRETKEIVDLLKNGSSPAEIPADIGYRCLSSENAKWVRTSRDFDLSCYGENNAGTVK